MRSGATVAPPPIQPSGKLLTLEELQVVVQRAIEALEAPDVDPSGRTNGAYQSLSAVTGHRGDLPRALRKTFDDAWLSFNAPGGRVEEILTGRGRFSLFSPDEIATCERKTRELALAVAAELAIARKESPPAIEAVMDPEPAGTEEDQGRAAAD
jgi:hypothetical protein